LNAAHVELLSLGAEGGDISSLRLQRITEE